MAAGIAKEAGALRAIFLEVAADNLAAIKLYQATGFAKRRPAQGLLSPSGWAKDALVMRRTLNT
jgi:ribosomal-protein-alanine N-acetyltransferase